MYRAKIQASTAAKEVKRIQSSQALVSSMAESSTATQRLPPANLLALISQALDMLVPSAWRVATCCCASTSAASRRVSSGLLENMCWCSPRLQRERKRWTCRWAGLAQNFHRSKALLFTPRHQVEATTKSLGGEGSAARRVASIASVSPPSRLLLNTSGFYQGLASCPGG